LALIEIGKASPFDGRDMYEHILAAALRLMTHLAITTRSETELETSA
jgi:hypothetical protein